MSAPFPDRPNFFDLLELDPDMPWEWEGREAYERQLQKMRARWASVQNVPGKAGADAKRYSDMIKNRVIQDVMEDDIERAREAEDCRREHADKRNRVQQLFEQQIRGWSRAVGMSPGEVRDAVTQAGLKDVQEIAPALGVPRVFLSHSHADNDWCMQLVNALTANGFDVWFDKQGLFVGDQWITKLQTEVESRDVFLIVLTTDSWNSPWVQKEFQLALHRNKRIIGVIHKPVSLSGFILTYQILDATRQDAAQVARQVAERLKA